MRQNAKWFVVGGSALVIIGFFLPIISVSAFGFGAGFSLSDAASLGGNLVSLYLILIGAIAALILSFLPPNSENQKSLFLIGEAAGLGLGVLILLILLFTAVSWTSKLGAGYDYVSPFLSLGIGAFILVLGYGVAGVGLFLQFVPFAGQSFQRTPASPFSGQAPVHTQSAGARLEVARGSQSGSIIPLSGDFIIGRASDSQLQLADPRVSRRHARIRYAQGAWFIQDQNSAAGTFVNGRSTPATRLHPGDQIKIGETILIFYV